MVSFIHKYTQLRKIAQFEKTLVDGQIGFIFRGIKTIQVCDIVIYGLRIGAFIFPCHQEKLFRTAGSLALAFEQNFLGVGNNQIIIGVIDDIERSTCFIQILQFEICLKPIGMF